MDLMEDGFLYLIMGTPVQYLQCNILKLLIYINVSPKRCSGIICTPRPTDPVNIVFYCLRKVIVYHKTDIINI